jgi:hypothetical protein
MGVEDRQRPAGNWVVSTDGLIARRPDARAMTDSRHTRPTSPKTIRTARGLALAASGMALVSALAACGSGTATSTRPSSGRDSNAAAAPTTGAASDATIDSCSLVSEAQLSDIIGAAVTVDGPALEVARGRSCTYTFREPGNAIVDEGTVDIAAWHGPEFFAPGTVGSPDSGVGADAKDDSGHGIVIFRVGQEVVQVRVISPDHKGDSLAIARVAAGRVASASSSG